MKDKYETIEELLMILDEIKKEGEGELSCPKALYLLCSEINMIKKTLNQLLIKEVGF